jgi:hypothetical protein
MDPVSGGREVPVGDLLTCAHDIAFLVDDEQRLFVDDLLRIHVSSVCDSVVSR